MLALCHRYPCSCVFCAALMVRLVAAVLVQSALDATPDRRFLIAGDADGYWRLGDQLAHGEEYAIYSPPRQVHRLPGFPVYLAAFQRLLGDRTFPPRVGLAVLGACTCSLTCRLGSLRADQTTGLVSGGLMAASPTAIGFSSILLSESLYALLLILGLLIWWIWQTRVQGGVVERTTMWAACCGFVFGCAALVRPVPLLILPALCLSAVCRHRQRRQWWGSVAVCLGGLLLTLLPWCIRNCRVTGHPVVTTLWSGPTLYDGLQPGATGRSDMAFFDDERLLDQMSEYDMNREYSRRAWQALVADPGRSLQLAVRKQLLFWSVMPSSSELRSVLIRTMTAIFLIPFLLLAVLGLFRSSLRWDARLLILVPVGVTAGMHLLLVGSMRYRFPVEFLLAIPAAAVVTAWAFPRGNPTTRPGRLESANRRH